MGSPFTPSASHSTKLQNRCKLEKRNLSYADLHSEVMNDVNIMPPASSGFHHKEHFRSKAIQNEKLVKYMSKLPSYLEKGEKGQDKPLNIGVLDWRSLENWQYYHQKMPSRSSRNSPPSTISTSNFSDGSSNHQRRGHSSSPAGRKGHRPTLQSYLNISPVEGNFECVESSAENAKKFQDIKAVPSNLFDGQQSIPRECQFLKNKSSEIKLKECKKKNLDLQSTSSSKGKLKVRDNESTKKSERVKGLCDDSIHLDSPDRQKNILLLLSRDGAGRKHSAISCPFETNGQKSRERSRTSSEVIHFEEVCCSIIPNSWPPPHEIDGFKGSLMEQHISVDAMSVKFSRSPSFTMKSVSPARNKISEDMSTMMPTNSTLTKSLKGSDIKMSTVSTTKAQNPSPARRLSIGLGRIGRSSNSKDSEERVDASACSNNLKSDKPNAAGRNRTNPLIRLLEPLLRPKAANSYFAQQSQKDSASTDRASTSLDRQGDSSSVHPVKVKLELTSLRTANLDDSHHCEKQGSSRLQAYLQIAVKNDLPLFTFAVDNNSDVLAATVRKFSSRKDDPSWIYTFFTIHEIKKNGGWLNHGSKGKDFIPNVVAQMKVSDSPFLDLSGHYSAQQSSTREFVLFAVDLRPLGQQTSEVQPNDELAAIVVKFPRKPIISLKDSSQNVRGSSNSRDLHENRFSGGSRELFSTTVILPGGVHGLPSKGEPSPLIERWLSGGLCDCGGWDLGCRVKVLGNLGKITTGQFEIFSQSQEEIQKRTPFFALSPLKNGIFSVEFDSSISLLQAFSICVAVLDSRRPSELQEPSNLFEEKLAKKIKLLENYGIKAPKQVRVDVPARYVSHPPHSPAGRV